MQVLQGIGIFIALVLVFAAPSVVIPAAVITAIILAYKAEDDEDSNNK